MKSTVSVVVFMADSDLLSGKTGAMQQIRFAGERFTARNKLASMAVVKKLHSR